MFLSVVKQVKKCSSRSGCEGSTGEETQGRPLKEISEWSPECHGQAEEGFRKWEQQKLSGREQLGLYPGSEASMARAEGVQGRLVSCESDREQGPA